MKQLSLPIDEELLESCDFLVANCNEEAYQFLIDKYNVHNVPFKKIILAGPKAAGKSRLAKMWASNEGLYLNCRTESLNIKIAQDCSRLVIDDFDLADEVELLHLLNHCMSKDIVTLMVSNEKPHFQLLDLISRLNSAYHLVMLPPGNDMAMVVLQEMCIMNKIKVSQITLEYMSNNLSIKNFVDLWRLRLELKRACIDKILDTNIFRKVYDKGYRM